MIQNTEIVVRLWNMFYYIKYQLYIWKLKIIPDFKAEFLALLQSHDPSEIIYIFWFAPHSNVFITFDQFKAASLKVLISIMHWSTAKSTDKHYGSFLNAIWIGV